MSTKTTFKRIALVAVAALGFGVLSSVSAGAADVTTGATTGFTTDTTSITVVGATTPSATFKIAMTGPITAGQKLQAGETLTASVTAVPTGVTATKSLALNGGSGTGFVAAGTAFSGTPNDLTATVVTASTANDKYTATSTDTSGPGSGVTGVLDSTSASGGNGHTVVLSQTTQGYYYIKIAPRDGAAVLDQGTYSIRLRLTAGGASGIVVQDTTVKVTFVTAAANSGAVLTLTKSGTFFKSSATAFHTANYIYAKIADANAGQVTLANNGGAPVILSDLVDVDGLSVAAETITNADGGTTGDYGKAVDAGVANATRVANDGIYGITWTPAATYAASAAAAVRVRYGAASATTAVVVYPAASTGGAAGTPVITAAGLSAASVAPNYTVPLTTTSATVTIPGGTSGQTYTYTVAYTGTYVPGDVSPLNATAKTVVANASGVVTFTITNATPVDGAKATVTVAGFASGWTDQAITWSKSKAASISVTLGGAYVALKSTNTFTATVTDAFGAPVAGVVLKPVVSGSNADLATAPRASVTTAADGTASITLTDAAAVAAGTDKVTFTTADAAATKASTITYAATAPVATALTATYNADPTKTKEEISSLIPSAGIYVTGTTKFPVTIDRNNTSAMTAAASKDQLVFRISAGVAGVPVVASASTGAYVFGSANTQSASRTSYTDADGFVEFQAGSNVAGANTITFTSGTATTSAAFWTTTSAAKGRFVTLTQNAGVVTAKVTDRYGNGVSGVTVQMSTNNGTLGNGQLTTVYTTDTTGSISVLPVGTSGATVTATLTDSTVTDVASIAGYVGTVPVESTLAAGNKTATLAVADSATSSAAAEAATDAAAEATDAANAATDAANAAAEAPDAATAAAQDAADAVAALSTQVSEMVNALKKQITALTNLVIKIQKKVKA